MKIGIVGTGRVGAAMAICLQQQGYEVGSIYNRTPAKAVWLAEQLMTNIAADLGQLVEQNDVILLTVSDRAISEVAEKIVEQAGTLSGKYFYHLSGSQAYTSLARLSERGASCGSLHPLQSFPTAESAIEKIDGTYFAIDGDAAAQNIGRKMVNDIGGIFLTIPDGQRALYHAAACMACNYFTALVASTVELFKAMNIDEQAALQALKPIVTATLDNICENGTAQSLTGPIVRGDVITVAKHIEAIQQFSGSAELELYKVMGRYTAAIAEQQGTLDIEQTKELNRILK